MNTTHITKQSSVTKNIPLEQDVELTTDIPTPDEGLVLVCEVLEEKRVYNQIELTTGRMSPLRKKDIITVALGARRALQGYCGDVPASVHAGDTIHLLNMGGVAGVCTSSNIEEVGAPMTLRVLGCPVINGKVAHMRDYVLFQPSQTLDALPPLVVISGTCMNVGKTRIVAEIIKHATSHGMVVHAAKLTGVSCQRDVLEMQDYGASHALSFTDGGWPSTVKHDDIADMAKGLLNALATGNPDLIVVETGDGILGEYGVHKIITDTQIQKAITCHIGGAHDPVGAEHLANTCAAWGCPLNIVSGPITDNGTGCGFIKKTLDLPAINAMTSATELFTESEKTWKH